MINAATVGPFVLVRFIGREFNYWNGCGFTDHRYNANKYCWSEALGIKRKMNESKDFPFKVSMVQFRSVNRVS